MPGTSPKFPRLSLPGAVSTLEARALCFITDGSQETGMVIVSQQSPMAEPKKIQANTCGRKQLGAGQKAGKEGPSSWERGVHTTGPESI